MRAAVLAPALILVLGACGDDAAEFTTTTTTVATTTTVVAVDGAGLAEPGPYGVTGRVRDGRCFPG